MKNLLILSLAFLLPLLFVSPTARAADDPAACMAQVDQLISLTSQLTVTKSSDTTKIRAALTKYLTECKRYLLLGNANSYYYYNAALELRKYYSRVMNYSAQGKINHDQALALQNITCSAMQCIINLYYPGYQYMCPDPV